MSVMSSVRSHPVRLRSRFLAMRHAPKLANKASLGFLTGAALTLALAWPLTINCFLQTIAMHVLSSALFATLGVGLCSTLT